MYFLNASMLLFLGAISAGCAFSQPVMEHGGHSASTGVKAAGVKAADTALALLGKPYKFGGDTPEGFDCSGLIRYSYRAAGMNVPHSTKELRRQTQPVSSRQIRKGDLVFFTQLGRKYSHVGIYTGRGNFIHAPSSGKTVRMDSLDAPYWRKHFMGARRF